MGIVDFLKLAGQKYQRRDELKVMMEDDGVRGISFDSDRVRSTPTASRVESASERREYAGRHLADAEAEASRMERILLDMSDFYLEKVADRICYPSPFDDAIAYYVFGRSSPELARRRGISESTAFRQLRKSCRRMDSVVTSNQIDGLAAGKLVFCDDTIVPVEQVAGLKWPYHERKRQT